MRSSEWDVRAVWAKAASSDERYHPLICHVLDTAAVAELLLPILVGPTGLTALRAALTPLDQSDRWIGLICGLHDLGKCSPAFQALRTDLAQAHLDADGVRDVEAVQPAMPKSDRLDTPHGLLTAVRLRSILTGWGMRRGPASDIAVAVGGHHGSFADSDQVLNAEAARGDHGGKDWELRCERLVAEAAASCGLKLPSQEACAEVDLDMAAVISLAGLTTVSDWIASDTRFFPYAGAGVDLSSYAEAARRMAAHAVEQIGLQRWNPPADTSFEALFPHHVPRPVQTAISEIVAGKTEPIMLVVEAPTGEGKTKAAFQAATALVAARGLSGFYSALPTRASGRQTLADATDFLDATGSSIRIRLLQGADSDELDAERVRETGAAEPVGPTSVDLDGDGLGSATREATDWFVRKKGLLAALGVGTIDRILMAGIRSRHVFVRLLGLSNKVVVIDEVHAFDVYMTTVLERLLGWLGHLGVSVIMLSATLPADRRQMLLGSWRAGLLGVAPPTSPRPEQSAAYPRLTWATADDTQAQPIGVSALNHQREIDWEVLEADDATSRAVRLLDEVADGGCVVAVHNLVSRVEETHAALRTIVEALPEHARPEIVLVHARLSGADRRAAERRLMAAVGSKSFATGTRPARMIVIGTQILEQSLDLDFDFLMSDLAPIDSLLQRIGRLHRHRRRTPRPRMVLTGVVDGPAGPRFPRYTANVYPTALLMRTWAVLTLHGPTITTPDRVSGFVDAVYGADDAVACPPTWERAWRDAMATLTARREAHRQDARRIYLPVPEPGQRFTALTERLRGMQTRRDSRRRDRR